MNLYYGIKSEFVHKGYKISVYLDQNKMTGKAGFAVELELPCGGKTYHCSPNIAESIAEVFGKAGLLMQYDKSSDNKKEQNYNEKSL